LARPEVDRVRRELALLTHNRSLVR
jgi:hypothetical protein